MNERWRMNQFLNLSRVLFCRTKRRKWSKIAFVYKNLKSTSSSKFSLRWIMWIAYQRARIHIPIPCWIPLIVILLAFYVVSLRNAAKKCLMARFCQNWLDSTFCWDISSWQSCVGTCSMHQWFLKWGESNTSVDARDNTNGIEFFENDRQEWPVKLFPVSANPW